MAAMAELAGGSVPAQVIAWKREMNNNSAGQMLLFCIFLYKHCTSFLPSLLPFDLRSVSHRQITHKQPSLEIGCHVKWEQTVDLLPQPINFHGFLPPGCMLPLGTGNRIPWTVSERPRVMCDCFSNIKKLSESQTDSLGRECTRWEKPGKSHGHVYGIQLVKYATFLDPVSYAFSIFLIVYQNFLVQVRGGKVGGISQNIVRWFSGERCFAASGV